MQVYKFYITKDYDQFNKKTITESSFVLNIVDYEFNYDDTFGEKIRVKLKEVNDSDKNTIEFYLRKTRNSFIFDFPFNHRGEFEFTLEVMDNKKNILEKSAVNTFRYEGAIYNEELIYGSAEWGVIQELLRRLNEPRKFVEEEVTFVLDNLDFHVLIQNLLNQKEEEIDEFLNEKEEEIDEYKKEIDNSLVRNQLQIDEILDDLNELFDIFLPNKEEGEE